ncbi:MAG: MFS transporter, partial [Candidatus Nanopelagicales bacterium]
MTTASARPRRDRPTWICYLQNGFFAWFIYAFGATQALLRDEQGTTRSIAALHGTFLATGSLVGSLLAGRALMHWGRGVVMRVGGIGAIIGIVIYTTPNGTFPVTLAGAFIAAMCGSFFVSALNAFVMDHQGEAGPSALIEANAVAAFLGLLAPLAIGVATATVLGWRAGVWVAVGALVIVEFARGRSLTQYRTAASELAHEQRDKMPREVYWSLALFM